MSEEKSKKELELEKTREEARMLVEAKEKVEADLLDLKKQADSLNEEKELLQSSTSQLLSDVKVCVCACACACMHVCMCVCVCVLVVCLYRCTYSAVIISACAPSRLWQNSRNNWKKRNESLCCCKFKSDPYSAIACTCLCACVLPIEVRCVLFELLLGFRKKRAICSHWLKRRRR